MSETDYRKRFIVKPGTRLNLAKIDPLYARKHLLQKEAEAQTAHYEHKLHQLQELLYAEARHSLLVVLQAMDAGGKDGTVRHAMSTVNPLGTVVTSFKQPTAEELKHDFLWRVHPHTPGKGMIAIFNRSHYEDVLVARIHKLAPKSQWASRYTIINDFEKLLRHDNNTTVIKFFLHISPDEQLRRFHQRLIDPERNWKISEFDYKEREYWDDYMRAYEDIFAKTSTKHAPWYVIPANHKWFRNLAVSQIVAATLEDLRMQMPKPQVDLELIRAEYHRAASVHQGGTGK